VHYSTATGSVTLKRAAAQDKTSLILDVGQWPELICLSFLWQAPASPCRAVPVRVPNAKVAYVRVCLTGGLWPQAGSRERLFVPFASMPTGSTRYPHLATRLPWLFRPRALSGPQDRLDLVVRVDERRTRLGVKHRPADRQGPGEAWYRGTVPGVLGGTLVEAGQFMRDATGTCCLD